MYLYLKKFTILLSIIIFLLLNACATNPTKVDGEDAQKILATQFGTVVDVQAVTIRGKKMKWQQQLVLSLVVLPVT